MNATTTEPAAPTATDDDRPLFDPNAYDDPRLKLTTKEGRPIDTIKAATDHAPEKLVGKRVVGVHTITPTD